MKLTRIVAHDPRCREAGDGKVYNVREALRRHPYATPHSCLPGQWSYGTVVMVEEALPPHRYELSMTWPAGFPRALCMVCRDPHAEELAAERAQS